MDLTRVNISSSEDMKRLEDEFKYICSADFSKYRKMLEKMNVIVGFGRGFWAGVSHYYYLVYHKEKQKFYWYLRNIEADTDVYFYEVSHSADIINLLKEKLIEKNFKLYDDVLDYNYLYLLSIGKYEQFNIEPTSLEELFGEDTVYLRYALMDYRPGDYGSNYPHREFDKRLLPYIEEKLDKQIQDIKAGDFEIYRDKLDLYLKFGNQLYKLDLIKREE